MAFDIEKYLDDLQLTGEDRATVKKALEPKGSILEAGYLRQQDYSAKLNEITALQAQLTDKDQRLNAEAVEWSNMTAAEKKANGELKLSMEKLEQDKLKMTQRLTRLATEAGVDPKTVLEGLETETVTKPAAVAAPPDMTGYVTREQYAGLAATAVRLPAMLMTMAREHKDLTGTELDTEAIVAEIELRANTRGNQKSLNPRDVWNETHGIDAKREAKRVADHNTEIAAAVERGRTEALSEVHIPTGGTSTGRHAPVLTSGRTSVLQRPQPGSSIAGAVGAFQSGKYRTPAAKTA